MSFRDLDIPTSPSTVTVKIFDIIDDPQNAVVPAAAFFTPVAPGYENLTCPMFAFLVENTTTKQRVLFDLGPRKDLENGAPSVAAGVKAGTMSMPVSKDISEQLAEDGVELESISAVIWSHSHLDHTGDMSKFPASTELVFSKDLSTETHESNPHSHILASDLAGRKLTRLDFNIESSLVIGTLKALDFFGDGSFYLLDVPGHQSGHVCGLARVTPTSFVLMGADTCHHAGLLRPTSKLHRHFPCPGELLAATRFSVSPKYIHDPGSGEQFDLASRTTPVLSIVENGYFEDPASARDSIHKIGDFDANPDVFVVLAHDGSMGHLF
ncbi:Metallo-beta-lactamase superfamily protein [Mycena sanguinolenta]|uniref:Metallo-beta-lactamase superfamily protein n=1 Tax=Mycena sanguinolenta TaxID=230812 RepID=A0A8H6XX94_9AGAR|nr:Metallo-beta-lactamase superfamily protein [Mycena sanguinolenta]